MIPANELRIGNKILSCFDRIETVRFILGHEGYKERTDVNVIYKHLIGVEECGNQYNLGEIKPVEITDARLLTAGFTQSHNKFSFYRTSEWFYIKKYNNPLYVLVMDEDRELEIELKSFHQIQNIFFAIQQKELPLPPNFV